MNFDDLRLSESPDAVLVTTPDGRVAYWSKCAQTVFGYTSEEMIGRSLLDSIVPPERAGVEQSATRNGLGVHESLRRRKDGSLIYVVITSKAIRNSQDDIEFIVSSNTDVTHLKILREAKLVEAKFRDILESSSDPLLIANSSGHIVLANDQAEKLFGYVRGEMNGKLVATLLPARYNGGDIRSGCFVTPRIRPMGAGLELYGLRKDSTEFPMDISLIPFTTDEGPMVMSAIRDIGGRDWIVQALRDKNVELQTAAEAKNRFLANVSHELRTPLNGIIGFSEFLADGKPGPVNAKQKEYLHDILDSGRHLLQLINDVLDLAKVEAGKVQMHPATFSLRKAIEEVSAVVDPIAQKKHIRVSSDVAPNLRDVTLDQKKLKQALYNLLSNAIKFTDDGGKVEISAAPLDAEQFKLSVKDTGIGIRAQDLGRLFREFEQLEPGDPRHADGSGLGLALTRKILELQGGTIAVESEIGKGSTFTLTLPMIAEEALRE